MSYEVRIFFPFLQNLSRSDRCISSLGGAAEQPAGASNELSQSSIFAARPGLSLYQTSRAQNWVVWARIKYIRHEKMFKKCLNQFKESN